MNSCPWRARMPRLPPWCRRCGGAMLGGSRQEVAPCRIDYDTAPPPAHPQGRCSLTADGGSSPDGTTFLPQSLSTSWPVASPRSPTAFAFSVDAGQGFGTTRRLTGQRGPAAVGVPWRCRVRHALSGSRCATRLAPSRWTGFLIAMTGRAPFRWASISPRHHGRLGLSGECCTAPLRLVAGVRPAPRWKQL